MSQVTEKLRRGLTAFLNPDDPVVSVIQGAHAQVLTSAETTLQTAHSIASVLGATGTDLDYIAGEFGLARLTNETDAQLQLRISNRFNTSVTPNGITSFIKYTGIQAEIYEPTGGSLIGWDPRTDFRYDRVAVSATFTRSTTAFTPSGVSVGVDAPMFTPLNNMYFFGMFESTSNVILNSRFFVSSGTPAIATDWTVTAASGGTISYASGGQYGGGTFTLSNTTAGNSAGMITQNVGTINQSTYVLSAYVCGTVTISVAAENASGTLDTAVSATGVANVLSPISVAYTPATGFTNSCTVTISGDGEIYATQLENLPYPTPIYPNDSTTAGTVVTRAAETYTIPASSAIGSQQQGDISIAFIEGMYGSSTANRYLFDWNGDVSIWLSGTTLNALIGGTTLSSTVTLSQAPHLVTLDWNLGSATLVFDQDVLATGSISTIPAVSGTAYIGSSHMGSNQADMFLGNASFLEASQQATIYSNWAPNMAIPAFAQTLYNGAFFNESLDGFAGGMVLNAANFVGIYYSIAGQSAPQNAFILDTSALDNSALIGVNNQNYLDARNLFFGQLALGKKKFLYTPGQPT